MGSIVTHRARAIAAAQKVYIAARRGAFAAWTASRSDVGRGVDVVVTAALGGAVVLWAAYIAGTAAGTAVRTFCDTSRICGGG